MESNKLADINHSHQCWQGHLPCIIRWILRLTALTKHLPSSLSVNTGEVRPTPLVKQKTNQGLTISCHLVTEAGNHLNEQKPEESAGCLSVLCFWGPSKDVYVRVGCSSGAAWLPAKKASREKDREGKREVKGDSERERDQGWGEIRWLLVSPPHTPSAQDSECSFISVSESFPAGSAALSVY